MSLDIFISASLYFGTNPIHALPELTVGGMQDIVNSLEYQLIYVMHILPLVLTHSLLFLSMLISLPHR